MNLVKTFLSVVVLPCAAFAAAEMPSATVTSVAQGADRVLRVAYTLADAPAVVTMAVETKGPSGWTAVGAQALGTAMGGVNRLLEPGDYEITWRPDDVTSDPSAVFDAANARVNLTAWPVDNPPDVMVVSLCANENPRVTYYTDIEALPGGLLENPRYRESAIVLKRISAAGKPWIMGTLGADAHQVTLDDDYYMGVFELTQIQHRLVLQAFEAAPSVLFGTEGMLRPSERVTYNILRGTTGNASSAPETNTPDPTATSLLGRLRTLTGVAFEMPTEAQWEYVARCGAVFAPTTFEGRYADNGGLIGGKLVYENVGPTNGTAKVGSYAPNAWGFYDMAGNVEEWCRDWYKADISSLNGACVEDKQSTGAAEDYYRVLRGGSARTAASACLPTNRGKLPPHGCVDNWGNLVGYRPYAPCEAK